MNDYYECLGVPRSATVEEIKKAYKQKAREHHPDAHSENEKEKHAEIFKLVVNAFDVLSDPVKKSKYDIQGYYGRRPTTPPPKSPVKTKEDFEREKKEKTKHENMLHKHYDQEPMNINCSFYGGSGSGRSIMVHVKLTPNEMKKGCNKSVTIKKRDFCMMCGGVGDGLFNCPKCGNRNFAKDVCGHCDTLGIIDGTCPSCKGSGMGKWTVEEIHFKVSPNTQIGHSVTLLGQGESAPSKVPGNVRIILV